MMAYCAVTTLCVCGMDRSARAPDTICPPTRDSFHLENDVQMSKLSERWVRGLQGLIGVTKGPLR